MKTWQMVVFGFFGGMLFSVALALLSSAPRGKPVQLLPAPTAAPLRVQVSGAVNLAGTYTLLPGSRVEDALTAAGGPALDADLEQVDLTAFLVDGERISIPTKGIPASGKISGGTPPVMGGETPVPGNPININTASREQLQELPGIGEIRADAVIAYRLANGPFQTIEEIQEVAGIGPDTFGKIKDKITVK